MEFLYLLLRGISIIVLVDAVASWFASRDQFPRSITGPITDPLYRPIRKILDPAKTGGVDLSPLIIIMGIQGLVALLARTVGSM